MTRDELVLNIADKAVSTLSLNQRDSLLLDWWGLGDDDPAWGRLPLELRGELQTRDEPTDPQDRRYDPLLSVALARGYRGMTNEYLRRKAQALGIDAGVISGEPELLEVCPCCLYRTLRERGGYDVCPVCQWEDDGQRRLDEYSHPNKMTLREGRSNFAAARASTPDAPGAVRALLREAYVRSDEDVALSS
jgi:hypothetical protein